MFESLLLTIVSTTIIGGIVYIIVNLLYSQKSLTEDEEESIKTSESDFVDNTSQEKDKHSIDGQNVRQTSSEILIPEKVVIKDKPIETKQVIQLSSETIQNEQLDQNSEQQNQSIDPNDDLLGFEEVIHSIELIDERPQKQEVVNDVKTTQNQFNDEFVDNRDKQLVEEPIIVSKIETEEQIPSKTVDENEMKDQFWDLDDSQNLMHLNKSRPRKQKSRPSVKVVFTEESDHSSHEDAISEKATELVDNLFEDLESVLRENQNKIDSEDNPKVDDLPEETLIWKTSVSETIENSIIKNDDSFEEIVSGDYKKFEEFSNYSRKETERQEISRKVYEISSVKNLEITIGSGEQLNQEMIDDLLKNFDPNDAKTEVFEENYNKITESETLKLRKGDKTEVLPVRKEEFVSHTKTISERSPSSSSLSKMSLDDLDLNLKSSKSRLSETIDTVTKPLLSSPTLFRRSIVESDQQMDTESSVNDTQSRIQLPIFGRSQSLLMEEMKKKEFRKSLKPMIDSESDQNISKQ